MLEPFLYDGANGWQPLGNLVAGGDGRPLDVNASGTVVGRTGGVEGGTVPFYYTMEAGMTAITNGGAAVFGEAAAVNNAGLVTGTGNGRAFLFNGATLEFSFLTPAADQRAVDINEAGLIIGQFNGPPFMGIPGSSAWIATETDGYQFLDVLIGQNVNDPTWLIHDVADIHDEGWILANAYNLPDQQSYQVLLRPIPEPSAALLVLVAAAFLGTRGRNRHPRRKGRVTV